MKKLLVTSAFLLASVLSGNYVPQLSSAKGEIKFYRSANAIPGRYIVVLKDDSKKGPSDFSNIAESMSYQLAGEFGGTVDLVYDSAISGFSTKMSEEAAIALSKDPRVAYVEEDAVVSAQAVQTGATWGLDRIDQRSLPLSSSFQYSTTGSGVHAYVIDSGIRASHQDFGGRASVAVDFVGDGLNGSDCTGHGTHVAGTLGGNTYGVAKGVQIHALRVLACDSSGSIGGVLGAINWVTANRINPAVVNLSVTFTGPSTVIDSAINNSIASGVTYSIAAGNFGMDACGFSPGRVPNAITVGAIASNDARPGYSNTGSCVDLVAPGNGVVSLSNADDVSTRSMNGTSMAAPHVAGVAALYLESNPSASPATVHSEIVNSTTSGVVWNQNGPTGDKLLYSWLGGSGPSLAPARVTVIKQVLTASGGTASSVSFGYNATNLGSTSFALIDNNAPPSDRFDNPNVVATEGVNDIVVTEGSMSGWNLNSISCTEVAGSGSPNVQNSTVDLAGRKATIKAEPGETVTCTFTSQELAPTSAPVSLSGRIVAPNGRGVKNVAVLLQDVNTGEHRTALTNSFGYFSFEGLPSAHLYVLEPASKRYQFSPESQSFSLSDNLTLANIIAQ